MLDRLLLKHKHRLKNVPDKKLNLLQRKPDFDKKSLHEPLLTKKIKELEENSKKKSSKPKNKWRPNAKPKDSKLNENMPKR